MIFWAQKITEKIFYRREDEGGSRSSGTALREQFCALLSLSSEGSAARWWMRVSAGVREDKDPTGTLPACATCISSRRSRCAQIRAESVAAHTAARFSRRGTKRFRRRMAARGQEREKKERKRTKEKSKASGGNVGEDGSEWRRWCGGEPAMNDRNQRNTAPRKLPGIHPEYIIHTGVPRRGGVLLVGSWGRVLRNGHGPEGREACPWRAARSWPCHAAMHHEVGICSSCGCIHRDHPELFLQCFFMLLVQLRQIRTYCFTLSRCEISELYNYFIL